MAGLTKSQIQLGDSATATQNFTLTSGAVDGTMKLARGNFGATTQDILTVDASGLAAFPQGLAAFVGTNQSLAANGYQKLPGGLIIQWGTTTTIITNGTLAVTFPTAFATACYAAMVTQKDALGANEAMGWSASGLSTTGMTIGHYSSSSTSRIATWIAIGV